MLTGLVNVNNKMFTVINVVRFEIIETIKWKTWPFT